MPALRSAPRILLVCLTLFCLAFTFGSAAQAQIPGLSLGGGGSESGESAEGGSEETGASGGRATLETLLEVLRDDEARQALITELEDSLSAEGEPSAQEDGAGGAEGQSEAQNGAALADLRSLGGEVADLTGGVVEGAAGAAVALLDQIMGAPALFAALTASDLDFIGWMFANLAILVVVTYGGYWLMALVTDRVRRRLRVTIRHEGWVAKVLAVAATLLIDVVRALVPWAVGYVVALSVLGVPGQVSYPHLLYLNAFIVLELGLALLRVILAPNREEARLVTLKSPQAKTVMGWSRLIASFLVYGQLVVLPLLTRNVSPAAGRAAAILGLALVLALVALGIWRMRFFVARALYRVIGPGRRRRGLRALARYWHVPALAYLAVLFVVALSRPLPGFYAVLFANFQIAVTIVVGVLITNIITRMIGKGIALPEAWSSKVPLLEARLNAFVPKALWVLRTVIVIVVIAFCFHLLGVIDFLGVLESDFGGRLTGAFVTVALIMVVGFALWLVLNSWVDYRINPDSPVAVSARERTLLVLMRNALSITLFVIILMFVLSEIGINIAPLLASAGVIGLAIGFGAQKLVQDIITGVFIQLEGAIDVGDVVSIGGIAGVVERLTVRSAGLRDLENNYHLIPFSSVDIVTNYMRGASFALLDIGVAYREAVEDAKQAMYDAFEELRQDPEQGPFITDEFEWFGLNSFGASEIMLRARIKTLPGKQWGVKRAYNAIVKRIFDERGIEIPFPHQTVYFGEDKRGKAPPLHVVSDDRFNPGPAPAQPEDEDGTSRPKETRPTPDMPDVDEGPDGDQS